MAAGGWTAAESRATVGQWPRRPVPPGPVTVRVPEGDTLPRLVCEACGFIHYVNPKVVVGAVCTWRDEILLCRRAIEPRLGYWDDPRRLSRTQ